MVLLKFDEEDTLVKSQAEIYSLFGDRRDAVRTLFFLEWEVAVQIELSEADIDSLRIIDGMNGNREITGPVSRAVPQLEEADEEEEEVEDFVGGFVGGGGLSQPLGSPQKNGSGHKVHEVDLDGVGQANGFDMQAKVAQEMNLSSNGEGAKETDERAQGQRKSPGFFPLGLVGQHGDASDDDDVDEEELKELRKLKVQHEQQRQLEQAEGEFRVKLNTDVLAAALMSSQQAELEETLWADYDKDPKGEATDEPEETGEWGADAVYGEDVAL
jgi:hypothetical protein